MADETVPQPAWGVGDCNTSDVHVDVETGLEADFYCATRSDLQLKVAQLESLAFESAKKQARLGFASRRVCTLLLWQMLVGGYGVLGIPRVFADTGFAVASVLIAVCCALACFGAHLLTCVARTLAVAPSSFSSSAQLLMPRWAWLLDAIIMVKGFGIGICYLTIIGMLTPRATSLLGYRVGEWQAIVLGAMLAMPLSLSRSLSRLWFTAYYAVLVAVWAILVTMFFCARITDDFQPCHPDAPLPCHGADFVPVAADARRVLKGVPVFIFAFTCHENVFTIVNELKNASKPRVNVVLGTAFPLAALLLLAIGMFVYAVLGDSVGHDFLLYYPQKPAMALTCMLYCPIGVFSIPFVAHPSRQAALSLMDRMWPLPKLPTPEEKAIVRRMERCRHVVYTVLFIACAALFAIFAGRLDLVLGVVGATCSTAVTFIFPGVLYAKAHPALHLKRLLAVAFAGFGMVLMPLCLVAVLAM